MLATTIAVLNLAISVGIVTVLIVHRKRLFAEGIDPLTVRQYERLNGRLDGFERTLAEDRAQRDARFDQVAASLDHRASEDLLFRRELIETEHNQLSMMDKVNNHIEVLIRRMDFFNKTLQKVPCVAENGTIQPVDPCPAEKR
jgi:hypothetical protein